MIFRANRLHGKAMCALSAAMAATFLSPAPAAAAAQVEDLRDYSIEELARLEIFSVSRRREPISEAPSAIYVITPEEIRRSGVTSLPEALRLAPNLHVARDSASQYAISARGFNSVETANKLLVVIDGRSVYAPLHSGVFWDEEHVLLEDVRRIEVISGPGGATWGANAVNGVISVITKNSADTQGWAARGTYGSLDRTATARFGGKIGENASFRVYANAFNREHTLAPGGGDAMDGYDGVTGGFRTDWQAGSNRFTFQGDFFDDNIGAGDLSGGNLLGRWTHDLDNGGWTMIRAYYDTSTREDVALYDETETADIFFQNALAPLGRHQLNWGGGYRYIHDIFRAPGAFTLDPEQDHQELANLFLQDEISLKDTLTLTLGVKFEYSSYSDFDYLPSARLAWTPNDRTLLWAAASRAIRTPVRVDRDLVAEGIFLGGPNFGSEELIAYEAGYRGRPTQNTSVSVSVFLNDYDDLRNTALSADGGFPAQFLNQLHGQTYGVEVWGDWQATDWWRLSAGLTTLEKDFDLEPGATNIASPPSTGNDPSWQAKIHSRMDINERLRLDADLRWIDDLPNPAIPGYVELDARIGWMVTDDVELTLAGINLLDESHPETDAANFAQEARRGVHVGLRWGF